MTLLIGCGGVAGDRDAEIEASVRAVYGLSELALEDKPTPAELGRARDRFCSSIALFSGERLDRKISPDCDRSRSAAASGHSTPEPPSGKSRTCAWSMSIA